MNMKFLILNVFATQNTEKSSTYKWVRGLYILIKQKNYKSL